mmetsp:Transcript_47147/g.106850  ORF Transcript_47147/g.106850 Transcript_47147/m.106850 type:complete len:371 (-) Transcript_47147:135-1247(-)
MPAKSDKANPKNAVGVDLVSTPEQAQAVPLNFYEIQIPKGETRLRLRDLVVLPCVLYRVAKYFFGATRRSLPISAIMGCVGGILAIGVLNQNLLDFLGIINESFGIKFGTMRRGIRLMGSIVLIVDGSVLSHGAIVASLSLKHYLCGPKGKIKSCRPRLGDQPEPRSWLRCFCCCCCRMLQCCWRQCIPRAARCFLQALRATVRGAFAVAAAVLLWVSIIMLVVIIVASSFCFILVLAVNAVCFNIDPLVAEVYSLQNAAAIAANRAWDQTGIVPILQDFDDSAQGAFWFLPVNLGLAKAVDNKFDETLGSYFPEPLANITSAYAETVKDICAPFEDSTTILQWCVISALVAMCGQILALVRYGRGPRKL